MHGSRDGLLCGNQFRFALRRPRNSPAMHSSVSALQTSAWEPSPVLGEAAAGAALPPMAMSLPGPVMEPPPMLSP